MRGSAGFTLIEMMVTVAIVVIVASLATSFGTLVKNNRRTSAVNEFVSALNFGRSEAVTRGMSVTVCRVAAPASCASTVPTSSTISAGCTCDSVTTRGWETGWILFADIDADGALDADSDGTLDANTEQIFKVHEALGGGMTLRAGASGQNRVIFDTVGASRGSNDTFLLCDSRGYGTSPDYYARQIVLSTAGRLRSIAPTTSGSCP